MLATCGRPRRTGRGLERHRDGRAPRQAATAPEPGDSVVGLGVDQVNRRFAAACAAAGLEGRRTSHGGRVGLAVELTARGAATHAVRLAGGWKDASMVVPLRRLHRHPRRCRQPLHAMKSGERREHPTGGAQAFVRPRVGIDSERDLDTAALNLDRGLRDYDGVVLRQPVPAAGSIWRWRSVRTTPASTCRVSAPSRVRQASAGGTEP